MNGMRTCEEWYQNDGHGLEHGYTIRKRPASTNETDSLVLRLRIRADFESLARLQGARWRSVTRMATRCSVTAILKSSTLLAATYRRALSLTVRTESGYGLMMPRQATRDDRSDYQSAGLPQGEQRGGW
jgi:hypothetical protein